MLRTADAPTARSPLEVVSLSRLMERTAGRPEVVVGLIDGPVAANHADLATENIRSLPSHRAGPSERATGAARAHGTYVAGILSARRDSAAPAICPGCTLLVRPIFLEPAPGNADTPSASPGELADAIVDCVEAGARILNLSVALATPSPNREPKLEQALDHAAARGTLVVAAAGNQGTVGGSAITRHPWVIPVVACDLAGRPMALSNLGSSIARRGLMAPGDADHQPRHRRTSRSPRVGRARRRRSSPAPSRCCGRCSLKRARPKSSRRSPEPICAELPSCRRCSTPGPRTS